MKKNIIITGATDGIGLAAAKVIASKNYQIGFNQSYFKFFTQ